MIRIIYEYEHGDEELIINAHESIDRLFVYASFDRFDGAGCGIHLPRDDARRLRDALTVWLDGEKK